MEISNYACYPSVDTWQHERFSVSYITENIFVLVALESLALQDPVVRNYSRSMLEGHQWLSTCFSYIRYPVVVFLAVKKILCSCPGRDLWLPDTLDLVLYTADIGILFMWCFTNAHECLWASVPHKENLGALMHTIRPSGLLPVHNLHWPCLECFCELW